MNWDTIVFGASAGLTGTIQAAAASLFGNVVANMTAAFGDGTDPSMACPSFFASACLLHVLVLEMHASLASSIMYHMAPGMYMVQAGNAAGTKSLGSWLQAQGVMLLSIFWSYTSSLSASLRIWQTPRYRIPMGSLHSGGLWRSCV